MRKTMIMAMVGILLLNFFTVFLSVHTCAASGNMLYVGGSGTGNYTTISAAINDASNGDTIYVYSGEYSRKLEINKILTITGENRENTIISGDEAGNVVKITANYVNISGFTIQNAVGIEMKCIMMDKVQNCKINNNIIKNSSDGIYLFDSDVNTISGNIIKDNGVYGILTSYSDNNIFENNQIYYNQNGISIGSNGNNNQIYNNDIKGEQESYPQGIGVNIGTPTLGNLVYHNYFNDFSQNAKDSSTGNAWYKSSTHEGNYWDDYQGKDANHDGVGDIPYNITDGSVQDIYPLGYFAGVNQPPTAIIDSVSPNPATEGQTVYFSGHGTDDGTIVDWEWESNINGVLNSSDVFNLASLSVGTHTISFRVEDDGGVWSNPDYETLVINPSGSQQNQKPTAQIVTVSPNPATYGDPVYFHGLGMDDGVIAAYNWRSDIDSFLNGSSTFTKSDLSVGTHIVYFKVRDNMGEWSEEVSTSLVINPGSSPSDGSPTAVKDSGGKTDMDTTYANVSIQQDGNGEKKTPGFEIITVIISITLILLWRKRKL
ncbi:MAG: right-handed parallel beta-helix repeat-containing protein [Euryarchaeota archaeon]|nr:right-handed parallel beta-helix repeat-containing protein [Euryarchaeota archaeon]